MSGAGNPRTEALANETFVDERPPGLKFDSLAEIELWVAWEQRLNPKTGKLTKVPISPTTGRAAKSTDPKTWSTRSRAEARARSIKGGLGIILGQHAGLSVALGGIDLDTCRDAKTGKLEPWAEAVLAEVESYAEVSPSQQGVKTFFTYDEADQAILREAMGGTLGSSWKRPGKEHPPAIELHLGVRYYTITGERLSDVPADLAHVPTTALLQIIRQTGPDFKAAAETSKRASKNIKPRDESRSGNALALAGNVTRRGGTREDFETYLQADPQLAEWAKDERQVDRTWKRASDGLGDLKGFAFNEDGVALAFRKLYRKQLQYDHDAACWYEWVNSHWKAERTRLAFAWARDTCRKMANTGLLDPETKPLAKAATAAAVERFAQADRAFAVTSDIWDNNPWLKATPEGTVELRTGKIRPAVPEDMITKIAAVSPVKSFDPELDCPLWLNFLAQATGGDQGLVRFLQQWCGYCLTGDIREHALLFIYGEGGRGKSVFLNTITGIMGDYCMTAGMEVFTSSKFDRHPQELARLKGARMVCASETEDGRAWAEVRIKQLTGGDTVTARHMRSNDFEYKPEFKLTIIGNHKPALHNVDDAMRRRFNIVPFEHPPAKPDRELESKLRAEWPAILSWMIAGCLDWQANGLIRPEVVVAATAEYFEAQDTFGQWIDDHCETGRTCAATTAELWDSWAAFSKSNGENANGRTKGFPDALKARGFTPIRDCFGIRGRGFKGVSLKPDTFDSGEPDL